jgi:hypothetical protein
MEEDDIAAAMGFSSFGGQKKRKYDQAASSPKSTASASGANSTRLGVRPKIVEADVGQVADAHVWKENDVVESTETAQGPGPGDRGKSKQEAATSLADFLTRGQKLPEKPIIDKQPFTPNVEEDDSSSTISFGGPPITKAALNALRRGVRNDQGDIAYFLPSFVEDPWGKMQRNPN